MNDRLVEFAASVALQLIFAAMFSPGDGGITSMYTGVALIVFDCFVYLFFVTGVKTKVAPNERAGFWACSAVLFVAVSLIV